MPGVQESDLQPRAEAVYAEFVRTFGATPAGLGWKTEENQLARFEQLLKLFWPATSYSLNDYGCGYGSLYEYLKKVGHTVDYRGYDILPSMVALAREMHPDLPPTLFTDDVSALRPAEYTVASGVFNLKLDHSEEEWDEYVLGHLKRMTALSTKGIAFNMRSSYSDPSFHKPGIYYADPLKYFDLCKKNLSPDVALLHDYGHFDFTILVRLEQ